MGVYLYLYYQSTTLSTGTNSGFRYWLYEPLFFKRVNTSGHYTYHQL